MVTSHQSASVLVPSYSESHLKNVEWSNLLVQVGQNLVQARGVSPVAHQVGDDAKCAHEGDASLLHATVGIGRQFVVKGTTSLGVGETSYPSSMSERAKKAVPISLVSFYLDAGRKTKLTNFSDNTADNQLFLASGLDGRAELGIVPGVDLALAMNNGHIGVQIHDFLDRQSIGTRVGGSGHDGRQVKQVAQGGVGKHVVAEVVGVEIAVQLGETDMVVDDENSLVGN